MNGINLESYTTGPRARRRFTAEQKLSIVQDSYEAGALVTEVARRHNVGLSTLIKWRKLASQGSLLSMKDNAPAVSANELKRLKKENQRLQRLLGKQSLQIELLQEGLEIAREKKLISQKPLPGEKNFLSD